MDQLPLFKPRAQPIKSDLYSTSVQKGDVLTLQNANKHITASAVYEECYQFSLPPGNWKIHVYISGMLDIDILRPTRSQGRYKLEKITPSTKQHVGEVCYYNRSTLAYDFQSYIHAISEAQESYYTLSAAVDGGATLYTRHIHVMATLMD